MYEEASDELYEVVNRKNQKLVLNPVRTWGVQMALGNFLKISFRENSCRSFKVIFLNLLFGWESTVFYHKCNSRRYVYIPKIRFNNAEVSKLWQVMMIQKLNKKISVIYENFIRKIQFVLIFFQYTRQTFKTWNNITKSSMNA